ncbi:MAG TPA: alpha/beta fold hydrolase [Candidatus Binatia bacterium]|nr:alpha/beta fold hydrolase [Candidatus Binatia bacterium]
MALFRREWGEGRPVLALHPLGLDSSAFAGFGSALAARGFRTIALDLPGFGRTPAGTARPTPACLAAPVIEIARRLPEPPVLLGVSLGGRVALEAGLVAPAAFRSVIAIAPALPWLRFRALLPGAYLLAPEIAGWLPLERAWPVLRWLAGLLASMPFLRDDELAQSGARLVYHFSCPATRASFIATARELALDPPHGPVGFWSRLPDLSLPAGFVWGERDRLISKRYAHHVALARSDALQLLVPCAGHWLNGPHHRCLAAATAHVIAELDRRERGDTAPGRARAARAPAGEARIRIGAAELGTRACVSAAAAEPRPPGVWTPEIGGRRG